MIAIIASMQCVQCSNMSTWRWSAGSHPVQGQSGSAHGDPHVQGAIVCTLHQAQRLQAGGAAG